MKSFENFEMPESRLDKSLTLEDLNDNLNKKLEKILNLLENKQSYSSFTPIRDINVKPFTSEHQSIIQQIQDKTNQFQRSPLFPEDKK